MPDTKKITLDIKTIELLKSALAEEDFMFAFKTKGDVYSQVFKIEDGCFVYDTYHDGFREKLTNEIMDKIDVFVLTLIEQSGGDSGSVIRAYCKKKK